MTVQTLLIEDWLPEQLANSNLNWRVRRKRHDAAKVMVWSAAKQEGIEPVIGKAKVTITMIFGQERRRDTDNLYSRCKGILDGLVQGGWIKDDSTEWLELSVGAETQKGRKATQIVLEPITE